MRSRIATRLRRAASAAALARWGTDYGSELLIRVGLPGYAEAPPPAPTATLLKLHHTLVAEQRTVLSAAFRRAGVPMFVAKGAALLGAVYRPGERFLSDIDLYIHAEHRTRATAVLAQKGYRPRPEPDQAGPPALRTSLALDRDSASAVERTAVDLHWTLDPVERVLPRRDRPIPARVWSGVEPTDNIPVPAPAHHAAILTHHLVHTDLLHVRSLIDLVFVTAGLTPPEDAEYLATCHQLRIGRIAGLLLGWIADEFGTRMPPALRTEGWNRTTRRITLDRWMAMVARAHPDDDDAITPRRIRRRLQLVDRGGAKTLLADLFFPPPAFLAWRWGTTSRTRGLLRHYVQLAGKALVGRRRTTSPIPARERA